MQIQPWHSYVRLKGETYLRPIVLNFVGEVALLMAQGGELKGRTIAGPDAMGDCLQMVAVADVDAAFTGEEGEHIAACMAADEALLRAAY